MRKESAYSVLLVSASEKLNASLTSFMSRENYSPVETADSVAQARRMLTLREFDIVIINTPLKDEIGINFAIDITQDSSCGVMLMVKSELFDEINCKVQDCGVFTVAKPVNASVMNYALKMLCSTRERLLRMEQKQKSFEEKIVEIKLVNRAKLILVQNLHLTEEQAHKFIEKTAMNERRSKVSVAKKIIDEYKNP